MKAQINTFRCPCSLSCQCATEIDVCIENVIDHTHSSLEVVDLTRREVHETCLVTIYIPSLGLGLKSYQGRLDKLHVDVVFSLQNHQLYFSCGLG